MRLTIIDDMLISYAVLLNRPQWCTEGRFAMQRAVWERLAEAERGDAWITVGDVDLAIKTAVRNMPPLDVVPSLVIEHAAILARARAKRVDAMLNSDPALWLSPARQQVQRAIDSGDDPYTVIAAIRGEVSADLVAAEVPEADMSRVLDAVDLTLHSFPLPPRLVR